ncbi:MAG: ATP-dependent helicase HrpB [Gammaproteobacteria bacterium]|nr:ATP-dependent helicase HrpB [Gammaproteobacteria bacterium]
MKLPSLPINAVLDDIKKGLKQHHQLVLQAPPGAGKTTVVPLALLDESWLGSQKILMLEPRRMAARTAAERMASLLGEKVGETVGYRIRQQSRISAKTRIEVITEGVLIRLLQNDPELQGTGLILFDEFHERSLNSDLGLALSLQARELFREQQCPLKLVVMSATLDGAGAAKLLGNAPLVSSEGKMYPIEVYYGKTFKVSEPVIKPMVEMIKRALDETTGSILVFLPGQREISTLQKELAQTIGSEVCLLPLYGALSLAAQMQAISPLDKNSSYQRKVVLSTDIAETSLTIAGISTVVDSGLSRQPRFDPATGMTRLHTRRISQASSIQRMGRAGRTQAGTCYRLWSRETQNTLEKQLPAEILQADLCPLALQLLQWGVSDPDELKWMDEPPGAAFNQALDLLGSLGALKQQSKQFEIMSLSDHGLQMAKFPTHPRLAHMLIKSVQINRIKTAAALAALLSDKDPLRQYGSDISAKVDVLLGHIPCEQQFKGWFKRSQHQLGIFEKLCRRIKTEKVDIIDDCDVPGFLICMAYPDRVAQRRNEKSGLYLLSNGRAAALNNTDKLVKNEYLAVAELGGLVSQREDKIYAAAPVNFKLFGTLLASFQTQKNLIHWNNQTDRLIAEQQQKIGSIVINRKPLKAIPSEEKNQVLMSLIRQKGLALLPWDEKTRQLQSRILCLRSVESIEGNNESQWPDVSDEHLLETLEFWLQPCINGISKLEDFKKLDLKSCLSTLLPWPLPKKLDELAPLTFKVPSGSAIKIDYANTPPVLAVKLQEMFGCLTTPAIANGKVPLLVHLLSPARKPLQITQDLTGFWQGSYQDVKKEMKGRYPKHPWPDDPLQALATRFTKKKNART